MPISAFVSGQNLLAVEVHQSGSTSDFDLSFDLAFYTFSYRPDPPEIAILNNKVILRWPDYLPDWLLEQSSDLINWTPVADAPDIANGFATVTLPIVPPQAFFRLQQVAP